MAVNDSRSMNMEFSQGTVDHTYISIVGSMRGGVVENPPTDRLDWPTYGQAERHIDYPHMEGHMRRALQPTEHKTRLTAGEQRY